MSTGIMIVFVVVGAALGFFVPAIANSLSQYKYRKMGKELARDPRFTSKQLKLGLCVMHIAVAYMSFSFAENTAVAALVFALITIAAILTVIDIRIRLVPNELLLVMVALGIAFQAVQFGYVGIIKSIFCMIAMILFFTAVAGIMGMNKVGAGDVKLAGAMGLTLGYPYIFAALAVMGAVFVVFCLAGIVTKRLTLKTMLPFAPFMLTGMVFALAYIA